MAPSAWPIRVRRARARVPEVHHRGPLRVSNKTPPKKLGKSDAPAVRRVGPRPNPRASERGPHRTRRHPGRAHGPKPAHHPAPPPASANAPRSVS